MAEDIARLGIEIRQTGMDQANRGLKDLERNSKKVETATGKMQKSFVDFAKKAAIYFATIYSVKKIIQYSVELIRMAGRYDMVGVAMYQAGKNAGYSAKEMDKFEKQLRAGGIAAIEARESLTRLAAANVD